MKERMTEGFSRYSEGRNQSLERHHIAERLGDHAPGSAYQFAEGLLARHLASQSYGGNAVAGCLPKVVVLTQVVRGAEHDIGGFGIKM
jgi:hypothetical protein